MDGTLLNTIDDLANACNHVLHAMGFMGHTVEEYKYFVGNGVPKLLERALPPAARGRQTLALALQMFMEYYGAHSADKTAPYPGIPALLEALRNAGVLTAVASNKSDSLTRQVIARYFGTSFSVVAGHRPDTPTKPDPYIVRCVLETLKVQKENTLFVGDSNVDIETARNAGLECCGVLWGFRTEEELREAGAAHLAHTPAELQSLILEA